MPAWTKLRYARCLALASAALCSMHAWSEEKSSELDALDLKVEPSSEPSSKAAAKSRASRVSIEAAVGTSQLRYGLGDESTYRLSLDWRYATRLSAQWQATVSDQIDHIKPSDGDRTINTLREAYLGWQSAGAATTVEFGRINLRNGPGYGYNPSDFYRAGSLRTTTTLDPIALRDSRMGTFAIRAQRLWAGGGISMVLAPKLADRPDPNGFSLDAGSTNADSSVQLAWSHDLTKGVSLQLLGYKQSGEPGRIGANLTALLGQSVVLHLEGSQGREPSLLDRALGTNPAPTHSASRLVAGLTAALPASISLTAELQHNGFALSDSDWKALGAAGGPPALGGYLQAADRLQELPSRQAFLVYLSKKELGLRELDLTALLQLNSNDHSRLAWIELRHRFSGFEAALQWQQLQGSPLSQYGVLPLRQSLQLVLTKRL